jgi:hypothetical protein
MTQIASATRDSVDLRATTVFILHINIHVLQYLESGPHLSKCDRPGLLEVAEVAVRPEEAG